MAASLFNIAKGRHVELYNRVKSNDPSTAVLTLVALKSAGLESHATLKDYDTLAAVLAGANDEATNTGYARIELTDSDLGAWSPDDTNDWTNIDIPDKTWFSVQATGGAWGMVLVCYDPVSGSGTDSDIIPLTMHDFVVTPNGFDIVAVVDSNGFARAT